MTNFDRELMSSVRPYFEEPAKLTAALGVLRYSEEPVKAMAARQPRSITGAILENSMHNRSWLGGPSCEHHRLLEGIEARYPGVEHLR